MIRVDALSANEFCFVLFICASIYRSDTFQPIVSDDHSELANVRHTCGHCCHDTSFPKLLSDVRVQVSDCILLTERAMQGKGSMPYTPKIQQMKKRKKAMFAD